MQINREIDDSVIQLLTGKNFAFVATLMKDGSPQITPTWIDFDGKAILIILQKEGQSKKTHQEILA